MAIRLESGPALTPRAVKAAARRGAERKEGFFQAAARGDHDAVADFVRTAWPSAHRVAYLVLGDRHAAEDVAQESVLKALSALKRFDSSRRLEPWIGRIAANCAIDYARKLREVPVGDRFDESFAQVFDPGDSTLDPSIRNAMRQLSVEDRAAVVMRHVLEFSPEEIGSVLGWTGGATRSRIHRAMSSIRNGLEDYHD